MGRTGRLDSLDGLRALAVLAVFVHHVDQSSIPGGFLGVDVFFVLSGYLITWVLLGERNRTGRIALLAFYVRRALRLWPALIAMVLIVTVWQAGNGIGWPAIDAAGALTYTFDLLTPLRPHYTLLAHTWSLAVEEQFYLFWPILLIAALARDWPLRSIVVGICVASFIATGLVGAGHPAHIQQLPFTHVPELGIGAILALTLRARPLRIPAFAALVAFAMLAVGLFTVEGTHWWIYAPVAVVCVVPIAHLVTAPASRVSRSLSAGWLVWLGARSYGFYLWHYPVLLEAHRHTRSSLDAAIYALPVTLMLTVVSWELIERPFLRRKRRFERPHEPVAVPA